MIEVQSLSKSFGYVAAVSDVSFSAPNGAITGLLGPNGAGKTTTLRMLYGIIKPDGGTAMVDGTDVAAAPVKARRKLGVLADARGLYLRLSARENIRYYGQLQGMNGVALDKRIDQLIDLLDMGEIADRRSDGFSQGERLKTAIARALVHSPNNVLLDEPTNGLDIPATRAMRGLIQRLADEGHCVVFSSHIMQEVGALCDQVVIVAKGRVMAHGTLDEIRASTGEANLEDAFVKAIGTDEGLGG